VNFSAEAFLTRSLYHQTGGKSICRVLAASLNAVHPGTLVRWNLSRRGSLLLIGTHKVELPRDGRLIVLAVGKAALPMAAAAEEILGQRLDHGLLLTKPASLARWEQSLERFQVFSGGHPHPNENGLQASRQIHSTLQDLTSDDLVLLLLSGGGSALLSLPVESISLDELRQTNQLLIASGADIVEINTIRKHLSLVKGGRLAETAAPAPVYALILSDVLQQRVDIIASGPTMPDPTRCQDALTILEKYRLSSQVPQSVLDHLHGGSKENCTETPKPGDPLFDQVHNCVLGDNRLAVEAALKQARKEGFFCQTMPEPFLGQAAETGEQLGELLVAMARNNQPFPRPACLIGGGEPTVQIAGELQSGQGGRNTEVALAAVETIAGLKDALLITLASDGEDGPTDAAGAAATGETRARSAAQNLDPQKYLQEHNSYLFFEQLEDLIKIGPTHTNVNDLYFLFTV